jgi:hypothetical protein
MRTESFRTHKRRLRVHTKGNRKERATYGVLGNVTNLRIDLEPSVADFNPMGFVLVVLESERKYQKSEGQVSCLFLCRTSFCKETLVQSLFFVVAASETHPGGQNVLDGQGGSKTDVATHGVIGHDLGKEMNIVVLIEAHGKRQTEKGTEFRTP